MVTITCPECGLVQDDGLECLDCGADLHPDEEYEPRRPSRGGYSSFPEFSTHGSFDRGRLL